MAKRTYHRRGKMTIPLAAIAGLMPLAVDVGAHWKNDGAMVALNEMGHGITGVSVDSSGGVHFEPAHALKTLYGPMMVAYLGHKLAGSFGVNRMLARTGLPFRI